MLDAVDLVTGRESHVYRVLPQHIRLVRKSGDRPKQEFLWKMRECVCILGTFAKNARFILTATLMLTFC